MSWDRTRLSSWRPATGSPRPSRPVDDRNLGRALAAFQRTLVAANSPFDRYMRGDTTALSADQVRGMERFQSVGCIKCHNGPMFSDFATHVLAVPDSSKLPESDSGVNKTYAFRTPSLLNLSATAPYMHNGAFATLGEVVNFYRQISRGGGRRGGGGARGVNAQVSRDQIDPLARQLNMGGRVSRISSRSSARLTTPTSIEPSRSACQAGCGSAAACSANADTPEPITRSRTIRL